MSSVEMEGVEEAGPEGAVVPAQAHDEASAEPGSHAHDGTSGEERVRDAEDEGPAETPGPARPPLSDLLEAVLFAAAEPLAASRIARALPGVSRAEVTAALEGLRERLEADARGIRLFEVAGGWQLRSAVEMAPWVARFFDEKPPRLSRAFLETVAVVAYQQPCTRGEVEAVRGVNCDAVLGSLQQRGLIVIAGRRQSPGRPVEYATTALFLELFALRDLAEMPPLPDPKAFAELAAGALAEEDDEDEETEPADENVESGNEADVEQDFAAPSILAEENEDAGIGTSAEDSESSGSGLEAGGGGSDPGGSGSAEREDGEGPGDEGGPTT